MYVAECFVKKSRNGDYGVCVMAIDWSTGAIVQVLKECGVYDNDVEVKELYDLSTDPSEQKNVYEENPELVRRIMEEVEICRNALGDTFTKTVGAGVRPIGKVDDPKPLTCYEEDYPYIIPMYDKVEAG